MPFDYQARLEDANETKRYPEMALWVSFIWFHERSSTVRVECVNVRDVRQPNAAIGINEWVNKAFC